MGFLTFDSTIHFYNLQEGLSQPQMLVVSDIDGMSQKHGLFVCLLSRLFIYLILNAFALAQAINLKSYIVTFTMPVNLNFCFVL